MGDVEVKKSIERIREKIEQWTLKPYLFQTFNEEETPYCPYPSWMHYRAGVDAIKGFYKKCKEYESFNFSIEPAIVGDAKLYSYSELQKITDFKPQNLLSYTLSGRLFRGTICEGSEKRPVIVKTWDLLLPERVQYPERPSKFCDEIELFTNEAANTHRNLVKLHGYCYDTRLAAVYEEEFTGVLADVLLADNFGWDDRIYVAVQLADLLVWLHGKGIAVGSVTGSCIMIDKVANIKVFDFGYVSNRVNEDSEIALRARVGWDAPEASAGKRSMKSDVYAFGLLLLVLITKKEFKFGLCPVSVRETILKEAESGEKQMVNECFKDVDLGTAAEITDLVKLCTSLVPKDRPTMQDVLKCLSPLSKKMEGRRDEDEAKIEKATHLV